MKQFLTCGEEDQGEIGRGCGILAEVGRKVVELVKEATADTTGTYDCDEYLFWEGHFGIERFENAIEI